LDVATLSLPGYRSRVARIIEGFFQLPGERAGLPVSLVRAVKLAPAETHYLETVGQEQTLAACFTPIAEHVLREKAE
jgi:hypothetical protein